jgi:K+-sensing histidine kinase KdpD
MNPFSAVDAGSTPSLRNKSITVVATRSVRQLLRHRPFAYSCALAIPVLVMTAGTRIGMPAFVFEHATILLVVSIAIVWRLGPAVAAAAAAALGDNVFLRDPTGQPTITGARDVLDAVLFVVVAVTVGWLVARARREKSRARKRPPLMSGVHGKSGTVSSPW